MKQVSQPIAVFLGAFLILFAISHTLGLPKIIFTDEFSYLIAADSFANGHITNPSPVLPQFFENAHIIVKPTYTTKYPPGQSAMLALGQLLFNQPYYGVVLAMAFFTATFFWLLKPLTSNSFSAIVSLLLCSTLSLIFSWTRSYIPGALPAAGMCLLLGSYIYFYQQDHFRKKIPFILGSIILSLTRPYEGIIFVITITLFFLYDIHKKKLTVSLKPFLLTLFVAGMFSFGLNAYYNFCVTGNPILSPNMLHIKQYMYAPYFWLTQIRTPQLIPSTDIIHQLYKTWEPREYFYIHNLTLWGKINHFIERIYESNYQIFLFAIITMLIALFNKQTKALSQRFLILILTSFIASSLIVWLMDYYLFGAVVISLCFISYFLFQVTSPLTNLFSLPKEYRFLTSACISIFLITLTTITIYKARQDQQFFANWQSPYEKKLSLTKDLEAKSQSNLVFVRYQNYRKTGHEDAYNDATLYNLGLPYTYNSSDINSQKTVFAHDLGITENQKLINYYNSLNQHRRIWLLDLSAADLPNDFTNPSIKITAYDQ